VTDVRLTPREREIVQLLIRGCSNSEIATQLGTQPQTVKNQLTTVFAKVGVRSRLQLAVWGVRSGLDTAGSADDRGEADRQSSAASPTDWNRRA